MTAPAAATLERKRRTLMQQSDVARSPRADEVRMACGPLAERASQAGDACRDIRPELIIELI